MDGDLRLQTDPETGDLLYSTPTQGPPPGGDLTDRLSQRSRDRLVHMLTEDIAHDERGQSGREDTRADVFDLLGIGKESREDDDEEAADSSDHPLLLTALLRFQAKALSTLLPSDDSAVRTAPVVSLEDIEDPDEREAALEAANEAGARVSKFYTEYLFEKLPAYEEDTDQILADMGLLGAGLRKIGKDTSNRSTPVHADYVAPENLIVSYDTVNLRFGRYTHRIDMSTPDLVRRIVAGNYRVSKIHGPGQDDKPTVTAARDAVYGLGGLDDTETHRIYEVYCELFLDEDPHPQGLARPYIVTIHAASMELLSIQRNWKDSDPTETPVEHFVVYTYHPGKNATGGIGLGDLLGNITRALRKAQRRAFEAAYLQNHPSGFKLASMSVRDEATRVRRGQFIDVDSPTQDIRAALMPHPFQGPSPGLITLAERLEANGKELGGIASIDFASLMKAGVAAGPAMAAFEESSEFQTAVHRRLYKAHRKELKLIHDRMREVYGNQTVVFGDGRRTLQPGDLMQVDVVPFMKPGQVSRQKMILEAQAVYDMAGTMPDILNRRKAAEDFLRALGRPNIDEVLLPDPEEEDPPEPMDPIREYSAVLAGKPIAAGLTQNHQAHIDSHAAQLRMLMTSNLPVEKGDAAAAVLAAHIAEHMGMQLMVEVAGRIGMSTDQMAQMPPELEAQIAPQIAQAIQTIETERRPQEQADPRLEIARLKAESDLTRDEMKLRHESELETMRQRHAADLQRARDAAAAELQRIKDEAAMEREIEDNTMALRVARLKSGSANAGASAGRNPGAS